MYIKKNGSWSWVDPEEAKATREQKKARSKMDPAEDNYAIRRSVGRICIGDGCYRTVPRLEGGE